MAVCFFPTAFYAVAYWWALAAKTALYVSGDRLILVHPWVWSIRLEEIREVAPSSRSEKAKSLTFITHSASRKTLEIGGLDNSGDEITEAIRNELPGVQNA